MRHRNVKGSYEKLEKHIKVIKNPSNYKGHWKELFGNSYPIHLEMGMGKGQFLTTLAKNNPQINYIGFEKYTGVLAKALEKIDTEPLQNLYVIREDIEYVLDIFEEDEVDRIYLNFSDPWPKDRHAKRRLTHSSFLNKYDTILKKGSDIIFKTDNNKLFEYSLDEMKAYGYDILIVTRDLHHSEYVTDNIMTEYESKFVERGMSINMLKAITK